MERQAGPRVSMCQVTLYTGLSGAIPMSAYCPGLIINSTFFHSHKCPH